MQLDGSLGPTTGARATGKGSVLIKLQESFERDVAVARKYGSLFRLGLPVMGVVMAVVGIFLMLEMDWAGFLAIMLMVMGGLVVVLGLWLGPLLKRFLEEGFPLTVYEHGIEWYHLTRGPEFVPWGQLSSAEETELMKTRVLALKKGDQLVGSIPTDVEGYERVAPIIMERVGKAEYDVDVQGQDVGIRSMEQKGGDVRYTTYIALTSLVIGSFGVYLVLWEWVPFNESALVHLLILMYVPVTLPVYYMLMRLMMGRDFYGRWTKQVDLRPVVAFVTALLVIFSAVYIVSPGGVSIPGEEIRTTTDPPDSTLALGHYQGTDLIASGPVTVRNGEVLSLVNSTLNFLPSPGNSYGLWVGAGGTLTLVNSTITCSDLSVGFTFEIHGSARIDGSRIDGTNADPEKVNGEGGVELYSDDIIIRNTTFANAQSAAVMTVDCSPVLEDCTFVDVLDEGVEAHKGRPVIRNCTFERCAWPMILWMCDAVIENCTFSNCPVGISMMASEPSIRYCTFKNIGSYALKISVDSDPDLEGNIFLGVGSRESVDLIWALFEWSCVAGTYVLGVIILVSIVRWNAKKPPRELEEGEAGPLEFLIDQ